MNHSGLSLATHAAALPDGGAPEWVHLLPAGTFSGKDGRGPYTVKDARALIDASLQAMGKFGVIDENHSTDLAAAKGLPAPAMGFIETLEARTDGIWAKVAWNAEGERLLKARAYRGLSPVFYHNKKGEITHVVRASLVNLPNLRAVAALHQANTDLETTDMDFMAKLRTALNLSAAATEEDVLAACKPAEKVALQAEAIAPFLPVAQALALQAADPALMLAEIGKLQDAGKNGGKGKADDEVVIALQAELKTIVTDFNALKSSVATEKATAFVDGAIREGRAGVKPMRDKYIAMHAASADGARQVEELIGAMPKLGNNIVLPEPPKDGTLALNAEQKKIAAQLGVSEADFVKTLAAEAKASA